MIHDSGKFHITLSLFISADVVILTYFIVHFDNQDFLISRFMTEGRGTLNGLNSSKENRTYPTIKIEGFKGPAKILVSCVEDCEPYRVHPHQVIGKGDCSNGTKILYKMYSYILSAQFA